MSHSSRTTVIVPVHNGSATLGDTLESLRRQTAPPAEVIVVDDCSSDRSAELADSHPLHPRVVRLGTNRGVAFARNTGLIEAGSDFVAFLDQDDLWLPLRLARLDEVFRARPDWDVVVTAERVFGVQEDRLALDRMAHPFRDWIEYWRPRDDVLSLLDDVPLEVGPPHSEEISVRRLLAGSVSVTTSYVLSRRLALQVGGFASWLRSADDWVLLQALSRHATVHRVDDPTILYRVHPNNTSTVTEWPMPLMTAAAAVRFGGAVVDRGQERDPASVGRLSDSVFLMHLIESRAGGSGVRARADAWAAWQLLAADHVDRRTSSRRLASVILRSLVPDPVKRSVRRLKGRAAHG